MTFNWDTVVLDVKGRIYNHFESSAIDREGDDYELNNQQRIEKHFMNQAVRYETSKSKEL